MLNLYTDVEISMLVVHVTGGHHNYNYTQLLISNYLHVYSNV